MARLLAIGTALPEHEISREQTAEEARRWMADSNPAHARTIAALVEHTGIRSRRAVLPVAQLLRPRSLSENARLFERESVRLAQSAALRALDRAQVSPADVSLLVLTSATGFMIPSADTYVIEALGLRPDIRRLPIGQLGCAGGVAGLARTAELLAGRPDGVALLVCVELPTLAFNRSRQGAEDVIAALLFADGAAAAVLVADDDRRAGPGLWVHRGVSHHFRSSGDLMAYRLRDDGFEVTLNRAIPAYAAQLLPSLVDRAVQAIGRRREELSFFAVHPGGRKVLEAAASALALEREAMWASYRVMREHGNMSAPTVLFVLDELLTSSERRPRDGDAGLIAAFGPGFSAEILAAEIAS
jgi:alkylresorcinol/alkylpyrone synthase